MSNIARELNIIHYVHCACNHLNTPTNAQNKITSYP